MKPSALIFLLFVTVSGFSQGEGPYRYYVPLPEKTFSGDWVYLIEGGLLEDGEHTIQIRGFNVLGYESHRYDDLVFEGSDGFSFLPFGSGEQKTFSVQSLEFESDVPLSGVLWMMHRETGQLNAVRLGLTPSSDLVIPQIGTNYFVWKSGFALMGIGSQEASQTNLNFRFFDGDGQPENKAIWSGLNDHAYLKRTPYYDFFLGELDDPIAAYWGEVIGSNPGFELAGYQTFSRVDGSKQSCAFELNQEPQTMGSLPLVEWSEDTQYWVTLTNSGNREVETTVSLYYYQTKIIEEEEQVELLHEDLDIVIPHAGRVSAVLGSTWFADLFKQEGVTPIRFGFETKPLIEVQEETEDPIEVPSPIRALGFVANGKDSLGASALQPQGNYSQFWLANQDMVARSLVIQNTGNEVATYSVQLLNNQGKIIGQNLKALGPSDIWIVKESHFHDLFGEASAIRFVIQSLDGFFNLNLYGEGEKDIAAVHLPLKTLTISQPE